MKVHFIFEDERWIEHYVDKTRCRFQKNGNGNLLWNHKTDILATRTAFKRYEMIMVVKNGWGTFELSRLVKITNPWLVMYKINRDFNGVAVVRKISYDEGF